MPRKSSQKLNLRRYMKEEMVVIQVKVTRSQHDLLMAMAKRTNQSVPELVALLLTDWVMPGVEEAIQDSQVPTDDPTPSIAGVPTAKHPSEERPANEGTESSRRLHENGSQTAEAPPQSPPAAPVDPSARRPVASSLDNDPLRPETPRAPQPTPYSSTNPIRAPQAPTSPSITASATQQTVPPRISAQPLPPTPLRPITPPAAKPPAGDAEFPPKPETRHE